MIDVVDSELKILNVLDTDIITETCQKPHYAWLWVGDIWTDIMPLWYAQKQKHAELKEARDGNDYHNVTTAKGTFDFDATSQSRIYNAIQITTGTRNWTLADGTIIEVTANDLLDVVKAGATRSDNIHNQWLELKEQVDNATTVQDVEAIKWVDVDG